MNFVKRLIPLPLITFFFISCSADITKNGIVLEIDYPSDLKIISRADWGWEPINEQRTCQMIKKITVHHSGEEFKDDADVKSYLKNLQKWSREEKKWIDIPYHFIIDPQGKIYEARPVNYPGDTNTDYDVNGHVLICVLGNFEVQRFNQTQLQSLVKLSAFLKNYFCVRDENIKGHKDYTNQTVCPGKDLYKFFEDGSLLTMINEELHQVPVISTKKVKTGIEVLVEKDFDLLKGKRIGLVTNPTGVDSKLKSTIDILFEAKDVNLVALYGPEHGVRGNYSAGEYVNFYIDEITNLPVYSLYGNTRKPSEDMIKDVDALVFDIQDIGSRSYTYISTMGLVMEAAAEFGKEVIILDRPNPLGGMRIEGSIVEDGYFSFVSQFAIPYIHGLTVGELAKLLNEEGMLANSKKCNLTIVPMEGWKRNMYFEQTGLPWVLTSPHIPHQYSPFYYAASGIIGELREVLSIGVGYTLPFQIFAAESINANDLSDKMNSYNLKGVLFRPITFKPYYAFGKDKMLQGVEIYITDYSSVSLIPIQFYFAQAMNELYGRNIIAENNGRFDMFDKVLGTSNIRDLFMKNLKVSDIMEYLNKDIESFRKTSKKYYLYD